MKYLFFGLISSFLFFGLNVQASFQKTGPYDMASYIYGSENDKHYGYYLRKDGEYIVIHDGKKIGTYQWVGNYINPRDFQYSTNLVLGNNGSLGFIVKENDKKFVIIDGKQGKKYDEITELIYFEDTKEFVYLAQSNGKWTVVEGDKEGKYYDKIIDNYFRLNKQDKTGYSYIAKKGDKQLVVMSGKESDEYDEVTFGNITNDINKLYYQIGTKGDKERLITKNWTSEYYDDISRIFGKIDGKIHFSYKKDEKIYTAIGDKTIMGGYDYIHWYTQSLDQSQNAYIIEKDNKESIWLNGKIQDECSTIDGLDFLSDNRIIYSCKPSTESDKWYVQVGGEKSQIFEEFYYANNLQLSPDKKQYSYLVYYKGSRRIVDGKMLPTHSEVYDFYFLNSGGYEYSAYQYASKYLDEEDRSIYVKDGKEINVSDMVSYYRYSEDKKNYWTIGEQGDKEFTYINGEKGKLYDSVYDLMYNEEKKYFQYTFEENGQYFYVQGNKVSKGYSNPIGSIIGDIVMLTKDYEQRDVYVKDEFKFSYTFDTLHTSFDLGNVYIVKENGKFYVWSYGLIDNNEDKQKNIKIIKTKSKLMKQKIIARNGLLKQKRGNKFISQVDNLVKNYNSTDLNMLASKIAKITEQQRQKSQYQHHLNYFEAIMLLNKK